MKIKIPNISQTVMVVVIIGLAFVAGRLYFSERSARQAAAEATMARDSALIKAGMAERQVGDWRSRFGVAQSELEVERELNETLREENKELREQGVVTATVRDTVRLPATESTDSTLVFADSSGVESGGLVFKAFVHTVERTLDLDWSLKLPLEIAITESDDGRRDVFVRSPGVPNASFEIEQFDYIARDRSFWETVSLGPYGSTSGDLGAGVCAGSWCGFYSLTTKEIGVTYQWHPFR